MKHYPKIVPFLVLLVIAVTVVAWAKIAPKKKPRAEDWSPCEFCDEDTTPLLVLLRVRFLAKTVGYLNSSMILARTGENTWGRTFRGKWRKPRLGIPRLDTATFEITDGKWSYTLESGPYDFKIQWKGLMFDSDCLQAGYTAVPSSTTVGGNKLLSIVGYGAGRGWEVTWKGIEIYVKARANDEQTARTQATLAAYRKLKEKE